MRAAVLTHHGDFDAIQIKNDLALPEPAYGEVRVKIKAAALNRLDLWVRKGWQGLELNFPHVICADGAGLVDALGEGVSQFAIGDAVAIDPSIVAPDDPALYSGLENQSRIKILGEHASGTAAEYIVLPQRNLMKMPTDFSFADAAATSLVGVTAWHSLITRGQLRAGESVLIVGAAGGVNSISIQIAKLAGAYVRVIGSNEEKCNLAQELGADEVINREEYPDWARQIYKLTHKQGVDIVVDNVGQATINDSIKSVRIGGRILIVGGTSGYASQINIAQIFSKQIALIGSTMGPHRDYVEVMKLVFAGKIKPVISEVLALEDARQAQETLAKGEVLGKIVLAL